MPRVSLKELMIGDMHTAIELMDTTRRTREFYLAIHKVVMAEKKDQKVNGTKSRVYGNMVGFKEIKE